MVRMFTRGEVLGLLGGAASAAVLTGARAQTGGSAPAMAEPDLVASLEPPQYFVLDTQVRAGERDAIVRVRRDRPTLYSLAMRFAVGNGAGGAYAPEYFPAGQEGEFIFDFDVDEIKIPVSLRRDLGPGQSVSVQLSTPRVYGDVGATGTPRPDGAFKVAFSRAHAVISRAESVAPPLPAGSVSRRWDQPPVRRISADWTRDFYSNLIDGFEANDAGRRADGAPCFLSRLAHGRMQDNGEVGLYADPVLYPQTRPYQIIDGRRALVAEKLRSPVSYRINNKTKTATYSSPIVSTETMPRFGYGRFSYRFGLPSPTSGMWPAGWQLSLPHWRWPDPEIDTVEISFKTSNSEEVMPYQTHWWGRPGGPGFKQGQFANLHGLKPGFDYADQHEYWCEWEPEVIKWGVDDMLTFSAPNRYRLIDPASTTDRNRLYMILQIAIGGAGGNPDHGQYPSAMIVDHMAHYAMPV